jgi:hypothetical protein
MALLTIGSYELLPGVNQIPAHEFVIPTGYDIRHTIFLIKRNPDGSSPVINITEVYTDPNTPGSQYGRGSVLLRSNQNANSFIEYYVRLSHVLLSPQVIGTVTIPAKIRRLEQPAAGGRRKSRRRRNRKAKKSRRSRR